MGVSLDNGIQVDNCLYVLGLPTDILDIHIGLLQNSNPTSDTFLRAG